MSWPEARPGDLDLPDPEEITAAVQHLSRYDPVGFLQAIAALVRDVDDLSES